MKERKKESRKTKKKNRGENGERKEGAEAQKKKRVRSAGIVSSFFSLLYSDLAPLVCAIPKPVSSFALDIWFLFEQKVPCLPAVLSLVLSRIIVDVKAACSFSCSIAVRD